MRTQAASARSRRRRTHGHLHVIPGPASSRSRKMCNFRPSRGTQARDGDRVPGAGGFRHTHPLGWQQALARGRRGPVPLSLGTVAPRHAPPQKGLPACVLCRDGAAGAAQAPGPELGWGHKRSPRGAQQATCASSAALPFCAWCPGGICPARSPAPPHPKRPAVTGLQNRLPQLLIKLHKCLMPNY